MSVDNKSGLGILEAVEFLRSNAKKRNFVESLDFVASLAIDPRKTDQNIRGGFSLPCGTGKSIKVAVFFDGGDEEAKNLLKIGAYRVGLDDLIEEVKSGKVDFDYAIATKSSIKKVSPVAKVLGPKGLMPSLKDGNIVEVDAVASAVAKALKGNVRLRNEKGGLVHCIAGKMSFSSSDLVKNVEAIISELHNLKPDSIKNKYIKNVFLTTTMGPSVELDLQKIG